MEGGVDSRLSHPVMMDLYDFPTSPSLQRSTVGMAGRKKESSEREEGEGEG